MRPHICPQCNAWRVQFRDVGRLRRILCLIFNLNPYRCGGCGWEGVFWEGEGRGWKKILSAPSTLARLSIAVIVFAGILYVASFLGGGSVERKEEAPQARPAGTAVAPQAAPQVAPQVVEIPPPLLMPASPADPAKAAAKSQPQPQAKTPSKAFPAAKSRIRVIGNSDSKRYHLPGMKYYNQVKAHHRVEFSSEEAAIAAGYHRAPR